jgi:hypothetical protein
MPSYPTPWKSVGARMYAANGREVQIDPETCDYLARCVNGQPEPGGECLECSGKNDALSEAVAALHSALGDIDERQSELEGFQKNLASLRQYVLAAVEKARKEID